MRALAAALWVTGASMVAAHAADAQLRVTMPPFERVVLDNGAVLLLMPRRDIPLVGFQAVLRGGALADSPDKAGTASILAGLLEKGAGKRDAFQFADAVAEVGGSLSAAAGLEGISVSGEFLARDVELMIELLADLLQRPRLDATEFETLRQREIDSLRAAKDGELTGLLPIYAAPAIFGEHAYARAVGGSELSLGALGHADVTGYYRDQLGADRLILAVTGDFEPRELRRRLTSALGGWARAKAPAPVAAAAPKVAGRRVLLVDAPGSAQTYFLLGNVGVARNFSRRAALDIANTLFGGRFTSLLNSELRIRTGLTYGARSQLVRSKQPGAWQILTYTRTEATEQAVDLALEVLEKFEQGAIDAAALESGASYVMGQFPTQLETAPQWAAQLAQLELYGLDRDYVEGYGPALAAVTLDDIAEVTAEVYPPSGDLVFVFIGDAAAIRTVAAKYGTVTEMKLADPTFAPDGERRQD